MKVSPYLFGGTPYPVKPPTNGKTIVRFCLSFIALMFIAALIFWLVKL